MKPYLFIAGIFACASTLMADAADDFSQKVWTSWDTKGTVVKSTLNKNEGCKAKGAMQIMFPKGTRGGNLKNFPVEPDSFYVAEIMTKSADKNAVFSLSVHDFGETNKFKDTMVSRSFNAASEWQKISIPFRTSGKTKFVRILTGVKSQPNTPAFFDDFKLTKTDSLEIKDSFNFKESWSIWSGKNAKMKFSIDNSVGKQSAPAAKVEVLAGNAEKSSSVLMNNISVLPGKTYTLSIFVKTKGISPKAKISLGFQCKDENFKYLNVTYPSTFTTAENCSDWKQLVITRKIPTTGNWGKVRNILVTLGISGTAAPGTVWFDDFEIFTEETE